MRNNISTLCTLTGVVLLTLTIGVSIGLASNLKKGENLYTANCAKCHGEEGEGFLQLYPPIHNSRFIKENIAELPCIIRHGLKGKLSIGSTIFNQIMPANKRLSAQQMSLIITFMQEKWQHFGPELTVKKWLTTCPSP